MPVTLTPTIQEKIQTLKTERKAVILAHNYQLPEVQDVADLVGDSLLLSKKAAETDADIIVFCGVHFMAETAAILSPDKTVLLPDLEAGCSLAATMTADDLRRWKAEHPEAVVVTYVNSTAEVKAESDTCCTSSNAVKVVESIPKDREILFAPDMFLGLWVRQKTGRKIHLWPGSCHVHHKINTEQIKALKKEHPQAEFLMHPECGCMSTCLPLADQVLSTEGMVRYPRQSSRQEFLVATETGILYRMEKENPQKTFYPTTPDALCEFMKMITLEKVLWSLEDLKYRIRVPKPIADKARQAIDRMVAIA
ncbi:MAG: quinolinate synthase NadA [Elusimicrobia bacterium]|nr:quinolinate synthase NadA [Candidatus Obscuribacterium magneticum]